MYGFIEHETRPTDKIFTIKLSLFYLLSHDYHECKRYIQKSCGTSCVNYNDPP